MFVLLAALECTAVKGFFLWGKLRQQILEKVVTERCNGSDHMYHTLTPSLVQSS